MGSNTGIADPEVASAPEVSARPVLKLTDRCDRCGAQAFIRAVMAGGGDLLFCGHHGARHLPVLSAQALEVDDYRHLINETSASSA
jgi:hypothetical protein